MADEPWLSDEAKEAFAKLINGVELALPITPENPLIFYSKEGDCLEYLASNDSFVAERLGRGAVLYRSRESGKIVGFFLEGIASHLAKVINDRGNPT